MFFSDKKVQLKIYYLFMLADGKCSSNEEEMFCSICKSMDIGDDHKMEIINFCENAVHISSNDNSAQVIREIAKLLAEDNSDFFGFTSIYPINSINKDKCRQVETIWNLLNLAYADTGYSEAEKKVVSFLAEYWEIDPLTLSDLNDTADTILALTRQKDWLKTTSKPYDVITANLKEIDEAIARMAKNVKLLIAESNIA